MKFDFWFDLPKALSDISKDILSKEEIDSANFIEISSKVKKFNKIYFLGNHQKLRIISIKL